MWSSQELNKLPSKRDTRNKKPTRFIETPDGKDMNKGKKGKSKVSKDKSSKNKKKKTTKTIAQSKILVFKKRGLNDEELDYRIRKKLASSYRKNSDHEQEVRRKLAVDRQHDTCQNDDVDEISESEIGPNLMTAVYRHLNFYREGTTIKKVPKEFRNEKKKRYSKTQADVTGFSSSYKIKKSNSKILPSLSPSNEDDEDSNDDMDSYPPCSQKGKSCDNDELEYKAFVSRIPSYIIEKRRKPADQVMFALKLEFTREEIKKCSVTGQVSRYPSFEEKYGKERIGCVFRAVGEVFNIPQNKIATLVAKKINYLRHSERYLAKARREREAARQEKERQNAYKGDNFVEDSDEDDQNASEEISSNSESILTDRTITRQEVETIEKIDGSSSETLFEDEEIPDSDLEDTETRRVRGEFRKGFFF